ncbi:hypothetical protein D3C78_1515050 [compost metagenome]
MLLINASILPGIFLATTVTRLALSADLRAAIVIACVALSPTRAAFRRALFTGPSFSTRISY